MLVWHRTELDRMARRAKVACHMGLEVLDSSAVAVARRASKGHHSHEEGAHNLLYRLEGHNLPGLAGRTLRGLQAAGRSR